MRISTYHFELAWSDTPLANRGFCVGFFFARKIEFFTRSSDLQESELFGSYLVLAVNGVSKLQRLLKASTRLSRAPFSLPDPINHETNPSVRREGSRGVIARAGQPLNSA